MVTSGPAFSDRLPTRPEEGPPRENRVLEHRAHRLLARALQIEKSVRLQVRGRCMEPLIRAGDWVEIRPPEAVGPGTVVLAQGRDGDLVCHRVLARSAAVVRLAGDGSAAVEVLPPAHVLGVVTSVERAGSAFRLDRAWMRALDRLEAAFHLHGSRLLGAPWHCWIEGLRRRLLVLRAYVWAATRARRAGTSSRFGPACSR